MIERGRLNGVCIIGKIKVSSIIVNCAFLKKKRVKVTPHDKDKHQKISLILDIFQKIGCILAYYPNSNKTFIKKKKIFFVQNFHLFFVDGVKRVLVGVLNVRFLYSPLASMIFSQTVDKSREGMRNFLRISCILVKFIFKYNFFVHNFYFIDTTNLL